MAHYREVGEVIMTTGDKGYGYIMLLIMCGMYIRNISVVTFFIYWCDNLHMYFHTSTQLQSSFGSFTATQAVGLF